MNGKIALILISLPFLTACSGNGKSSSNNSDNTRKEQEDDYSHYENYSDLKFIKNFNKETFYVYISDSNNGFKKKTKSTYSTNISYEQTVFNTAKELFPDEDFEIFVKDDNKYAGIFDRITYYPKSGAFFSFHRWSTADSQSIGGTTGQYFYSGFSMFGPQQDAVNCYSGDYQQAVTNGYDVVAWKAALEFTVNLYSIPNDICEYSKTTCKYHISASTTSGVSKAESSFLQSKQEICSSVYGQIVASVYNIKSLLKSFDSNIELFYKK